MPSQYITILLYPVINIHGDLVSALFKHGYNFLIKVDHETT